MDPRHEPIKQEILNQLIAAINLYLKENTDTFLQNSVLQQQLKKICQAIYACLKVPLQIEEIFSAKNLLSIDVVYLPEIRDALDKQALQQDIFLSLMQALSTLSTEDQDFNQRIKQIVSHSHSR